VLNKGDFMKNKWFNALALIAFGGLALTACMPQAAAPTPASAACKVTPPTLTTPQGVAFVRTPDACFQNLPNWPYEAKYVEIDGLRQAYAEAGPANGKPILLLHGQPSWSYLYRFMMPELAKAGYRVIAMDHLGMGRSDKPIDFNYHTFKNHVNRLETFINKLELKDLTLFAQDWGSVIGLYLGGTKLETFERIILANGGLPIVKKPFSWPSDTNAAAESFERLLTQIPPQQPFFFDEAGNSLIPVPAEAQQQTEGDVSGFGQWATYARYSKNFKASVMLESLTFKALTPDELAAYDAPFPTEITMTGPRSFPSLLNQMVGLSEEAMAGLKTYKKPFLTIFGGNELGGVERESQKWFIANVPGAAGQAHHTYRDASHMVQDDKGQDIAVRINAFMTKNAR
jgi:haloalkane dehalogenase